MDITVRRNAYGPQRLSFETQLDIKELGPEPFPAVFIRAPQIISCAPHVSVMATIGDTITMARQGNLLVTTFHPEITDDLRVHRYFLSMVTGSSTDRLLPQIAEPSIRSMRARIESPLPSLVAQATG
jgi:5'-phosphate synthase pdxT subunit